MNQRLATVISSLHPMERMNLTLSTGGMAAMFAFAPGGFATSYALGVALEAVNFRALVACSARLFSGELAGGRPWAAMMAMRLFVLCSALAVALWGGAHPLGLLAGVSTVVPAIAVAAWIHRPQGDTPLPALAPDDPSWDRWSVWRAGEIEIDEEDDA